MPSSSSHRPSSPSHNPPSSPSHNIPKSFPGSPPRKLSSPSRAPNSPSQESRGSSSLPKGPRRKSARNSFLLPEVSISSFDSILDPNSLLDNVPHTQSSDREKDTVGGRSDSRLRAHTTQGLRGVSRDGDRTQSPDQFTKHNRATRSAGTAPKRAIKSSNRIHRTDSKDSTDSKGKKKTGKRNLGSRSLDSVVADTTTSGLNFIELESVGELAISKEIILTRCLTEHKVWIIPSDKFKKLPRTYRLRRKCTEESEKDRAFLLFAYLRLHPYSGRPCLGYLHLRRRGLHLFEKLKPDSTCYSDAQKVQSVKRYLC